MNHSGMRRSFHRLPWGARTKAAAETTARTEKVKANRLSRMIPTTAATAASRTTHRSELGKSLAT